MRGFLNFYINFPDYTPDSKVNEILELIKSHNQQLIETLQADGYGVMFVPTQKEACRTEKIDLDLPFPRYVLPSMDVTKSDQIIEKAVNNMRPTLEGDF